MSSIYHIGEQKVQMRAGSCDVAQTMNRTIYPVIAHIFVEFIHSQPMVFIGSVDHDGLVWASLLGGQPGFMSVMDERTLKILALPHASDPLLQNLQDGCQVGLLIIDFLKCRRLRLNGSARMGEGCFSVQPDQVYSNCPKYIQTREYDDAPEEGHRSPQVVRQAHELHDELVQKIGRADTFFLASYHPEGGADVSHRGGFPGFLRAVDQQTLIWPDYAGNGMFNSLGNIVENHSAGLLLIDFENGGTIQLSGVARVLWEDERIADFPGAERLVEFRLHKLIETDDATTLRWKFIDYSPDIPWFF
ncbi:MAG: pyridoxamine 5'-phosphate oxidase family protein [Desulfuromonadales bacterium]|nr:pyridoxamine 5'-phosphate oxidase family protein [Desulfuromonadales bacterium]